MQLGFFTMPIHPVGRDWRETLAEDREAFLLAEELGFVEAYVGEHFTDLAETITSAAMFLAWIGRETSRIRLGTGTINMPNKPPGHGRLPHRHARPHARRPAQLRHQPGRPDVGR